MKQVCDLVQGDLKMECVESINGYTAEIVEAIVNKVHPSDVCEYVGLCKAKLKVGSLYMFHSYCFKIKIVTHIKVEMF